MCTLLENSKKTRHFEDEAVDDGNLRILTISYYDRDSKNKEIKASHGRSKRC
jgi:hypothetical protein